MFQRAVYDQLQNRLNEPRRFIQVLSGPRQIGKTTSARQMMDASSLISHFASADAVGSADQHWISQQWEVARLKLAHDEGLLILDEIQKVPGWSEQVKKLWDEDSASLRPLKVVLLGSSPWLVQRGLTESLAGRFELIPMTHWSYPEMHAAFGMTLDEYIYFGGYPGAAGLRQDEQRWKQYILDSLIETTIARDILLTTQVNKPALLRQLFYLGCQYSGQILSYQKMVGQMQDAGNTTTLAHYLELLEGAGMLAGVMKYAGQKVRQRGSSPKFQVMNMALASALSNRGFEQTRHDPEIWGRWVESAIGAYLINTSRTHGFSLYYWRERNREVDFVVEYRGCILVIEVKSHRRPGALPGMDAFIKAFQPDKSLLIGGDGLDIESFLTMSPESWLP